MLFLTTDITDTLYLCLVFFSLLCLLRAVLFSLPFLSTLAADSFEYLFNICYCGFTIVISIIVGFMIRAFWIWYRSDTFFTNSLTVTSNLSSSIWPFVCWLTLNNIWMLQQSILLSLDAFVCALGISMLEVRVKWLDRKESCMGNNRWSRHCSIFWTLA